MVREKPIYKGKFCKKGDLDSLHIQGEGGLAKKKRMVFLSGNELIPQCTLYLINLSAC